MRRPLASTTSYTGRRPTDHTLSLGAAAILPRSSTASTSGVVPTRLAIGTRALRLPEDGRLQADDFDLGRAMEHLDELNDAEGELLDPVAAEPLQVAAPGDER